MWKCVDYWSVFRNNESLPYWSNDGKGIDCSWRPISHPEVLEDVSRKNTVCLFFLSLPLFYILSLLLFFIFISSFLFVKQHPSFAFPLLAFFSFFLLLSLTNVLINNRSGEIDPSFVVTHRGTLATAPKLYQQFNDRTDGVIKVFLRTSASPAQ